MKSQTTGFVVTQVIAGSPADKAGIIGRIQNGNIPAGDIIIGIDNNKQVKSIQDILNYVGSSKNVGDIVVFKVLRGGGINNINYIIKDIPVKLEQRPELQNVH